jgi:hypothetical protein
LSSRRNWLALPLTEAAADQLPAQLARGFDDIVRRMRSGGANLPVRTRVSNDDLASDFARWYPGFTAPDQRQLVDAA